VEIEICGPVRNVIRLKGMEVLIPLDNDDVGERSESLKSMAREIEISSKKP